MTYTVFNIDGNQANSDLNNVTRIHNMILVGKPEGKRPLGRPRCRWVINNKMDLRVMGWYRLD
jgi:hypothetical protein